MKNIEQLKFSDFKLVYYIGLHQNLTKAGQMLYLSQPATSLKFKQIESLIGQEIAVKSNKKIRLNRIGKLLAEHYLLNKNNLNLLEDQINEDESDYSGEVNIGCSDTIAIHLLPRLVRAIADNHPNIKLNITSKPSRIIAQEVLDGKVDFGVGLNNSVTDRFEQVPLFKREDCLVVANNNKYAGIKSAKLKLFEGEDLITLDKASQSRHFILDWFKSHDIKINIRMELASIEMIKKYVELDYGFSILPNFALKDSKTLHAISIRDDVPYGTISVFYDKRKYINRISKLVIDRLAEMYSDDLL